MARMDDKRVLEVDSGGLCEALGHDAGSVLQDTSVCVTFDPKNPSGSNNIFVGGFFNHVSNLVLGHKRKFHLHRLFPLQPIPSLHHLLEGGWAVVNNDLGYSEECGINGLVVTRSRCFGRKLKTFWQLGLASSGSAVTFACENIANVWG